MRPHSSGSRAVRDAARFPIDNPRGSTHDTRVQRFSSPPDLLVPRETRAASVLRRRRLARLDWLLWRIEERNWREEPEAPAPWSLLAEAMRLDCHLRWPCTGGMLHAAVLDRQVDLMRPVYIVLHNSLRDEEGRLLQAYPAAASLQEIA